MPPLLLTAASTEAARLVADSRFRLTLELFVFGVYAVHASLSLPPGGSAALRFQILPRLAGLLRAFRVLRFVVHTPLVATTSTEDANNGTLDDEEVSVCTYVCMYICVCCGGAFVTHAPFS